MMMPFGRSVCATATIPPIVTNMITKTAAMVLPTSGEIAPSVNDIEDLASRPELVRTPIVVKAMMSAIAPNNRANLAVPHFQDVANRVLTERANLCGDEVDDRRCGWLGCHTALHPA